MKTNFKKWPKIQKFSDVVKHAHKYGVSSITYRAKIKLDGTNAGIRVIDSDKIIPQKRNSDAGHSHFDFHTYTDLFVLKKKLVDTLKIYHEQNNLDVQDVIQNFIFYGEWAGKGIQKGWEESKRFYLFSFYDINEDRYHYDPGMINFLWNKLFMDTGYTPYIIPWINDQFHVVDFNSQKSLESFSTVLDETVSSVEKVDPLIESLYGRKTESEGLVWYPHSITSDQTYLSNQLPSWAVNYLFKSKTPKFSVNRVNHSKIIPEKPEGIDEFVQMFYTKARFEQVMESLEDFSMKNLGLFLRSVNTDIHEESVNELAETNFSWRDAANYGTSTAKSWFLSEKKKKRESDTSDSL